MTASRSAGACASIAGDSQIPVIFISSHDDTSTKLKGFDVGGVDYVTKPIVRAELLARVSTHLRLKQAFDMLVELQAERIRRLSTVQESLMPRPADLPAARFEVVLEQMLQAGGDFYDVIPVGDEIVDYLVADVSGHDLRIVALDVVVEDPARRVRHAGEHAAGRRAHDEPRVVAHPAGRRVLHAGAMSA